MPRVWVSIGSNVERERHVRAAVAELREMFGALAVSPVYESRAVGAKDAPPFYNLVVGFETDESAEHLTRRFRAMEHAHGRRRSGDKFAPRTLDVDLLTYGDQVLRSDGLEIPRDEITHYAFVLRPLADLAGNERHPLTGRTYRELWADFDATGQPLWPVDLDLNAGSSVPRPRQ